MLRKATDSLGGEGDTNALISTATDFLSGDGTTNSVISNSNSCVTTGDVSGQLSLVFNAPNNPNDDSDSQRDEPTFPLLPADGEFRMFINELMDEDIDSECLRKMKTFVVGKLGIKRTDVSDCDKHNFFWLLLEKKIISQYNLFYLELMFKKFKMTNMVQKVIDYCAEIEDEPIYFEEESVTPGKKEVSIKAHIKGNIMRFGEVKPLIRCMCAHLRLKEEEVLVSQLRHTNSIELTIVIPKSFFRQLKKRAHLLSALKIDRIIISEREILVINEGAKTVTQPLSATPRHQLTEMSEYLNDVELSSQRTSSYPDVRNEVQGEVNRVSSFGLPQKRQKTTFQCLPLTSFRERSVLRFLILSGATHFPIQAEGRDLGILNV